MRSYWSGCSIIRTRSCEEAADRIDALNADDADGMTQIQMVFRRTAEGILLRDGAQVVRACVALRPVAALPNHADVVRPVMAGIR
jgi:hypothetical protein